MAPCVVRSFTPAAAFGIAVWVMLFASGCTKHERPVDEGLRTKTLLVGNQNEPVSLDPSLVYAHSDMRIAIALFEGLTVLDAKTSEPLPGVAERWDISADGLIYTFHLRAGAKWSNGERLTAGDFVYSFRRILTPALGATFAFMLWPIKNAQSFNEGKLDDFGAVGVNAMDDLTLRIILAHPTPYLLTLAANSTWFPVPQKTVEKFGRLDARNTHWTRPGNLVGNGAFMLTEWSPNARLTVAKNPHYWDAAQNDIERVIFFPMEKAEAEELSFRAGQLHVTNSLPASKIARYRQTSPDALRIDPVLGTEFLSFNVTKPPLNITKVRRALALALDRSAIAARVYESARLPAHTVVPLGCDAYTPPAGQRDDFAAARDLLAESGFSGGNGLPELTLQVVNDSFGPKTAEIIQATWQRELGVKIAIEPLELKSFNQNMEALTYTIALTGWGADYIDPLSFLDIFRAGNLNMRTGWSSKEYDKLLDEALLIADGLKRFAVLQRAETTLLEEAPIAPTVFIARVFAIHPAVKNWQPSPLALNRYQLVELKN